MADKNKKVDFRYNFKIYWEFIKKYKFLVIAIIFATIVLSFKQVVDRYLLKVIVDNGSSIASGTLSISSFENILLIVALVFAGASLITTFFNWLEIRLINNLENKTIADLKRKFFNHLLGLDHSFHVSHKTGSLISRIIRGGAAMERMTDTFAFNFLNTFFQIIIVTFSLIYLDWISAVVILGVVAVFLAYSFYIQKIQEEDSLEYNKKEDWEKANISDVFTNIDSIKYFGKEKFIESRYKKLSEDTKKIELKLWNYFSWMSGGQTLILAVGTFLVVFFSLRNFFSHTISLGTLTYVYTIYLSLTGGMYNLIQGVRGFYRSMADFQDLFQYNKVEKEIIDKSDAKELKVLKGEVFFDGITFRYKEKSLFGLKDFTLKIKPGEKVAIVGHSGSGKTTLIKLLYRLYDIDSGRIEIDGEDIRNVQQESLRSELSIVPQECVLFDDTIFNNIKFSNPYASRKQVIDAIQFAQLDRFVNSLPKKENTIVGERGVKLSGGEKQRVSIARAILANKKILVLDEATSSLDSETEHEIQKNLHRLLEGRTAIMIAHRLSTIMSADRIVVMKGGKIIQEGGHNQLINKEGEYRKLWNLQKGGYIE